MIKEISVIGAGTMGSNIALTFAMYGYRVSIYDPSEKVLKGLEEDMRRNLNFLVEQGFKEENVIKKTISNINIFKNLEDSVTNSDYVIEAIPEKIELKQRLFLELDEYCNEDTIFASNTSSLFLKDIIELLPEKRKKKTMICHWYNPAHLIPMVELSFFGNMDEKTYGKVEDLYVKCEKKPIKVLKDIPGLVANRMLHALAREVFFLIENKVASAEDIDSALKFGPGFRSATTGILEAADMGGLDIWCIVQEELFKELNNAVKPSKLLIGNVEKGNLGLKSGEGFFKYKENERNKVQERFFERLITQLKASKEFN